MVKESKYCSHVIKKLFKALQNVYNTFVKGDIKVRDYCHVTGRGTTERQFELQNSHCVSQSKKWWCTTYYARTWEI